MLLRYFNQSGPILKRDMEVAGAGAVREKFARGRSRSGWESRCDIANCLGLAESSSPRPHGRRSKNPAVVSVSGRRPGDTGENISRPEARSTFNFCLAFPKNINNTQVEIGEISLSWQNGNYLAVRFGNAS